MIVSNRTMWSSLKTHNVTVSVKPSPSKTLWVFQVMAMIDCGIGNQKAVLGAFEQRSIWDDFKLDVFDGNVANTNFVDLVFTSNLTLCMSEREACLKQHEFLRDLEKIDEQVLTPGDLIILKEKGKRTQNCKPGFFRPLDKLKHYKRIQHYAL